MLLVEKNDFNEKYYKKVARYALFQIIVNFILTIVKFIGGFISTSSALISDGVDSLGDVATSLIGAIGNKSSSKKADDSHQFGHEKIENLITFIFSIVLIISGILLIVEAITSLINKEYLDIDVSSKLLVGLIITFFCILIKGIMGVIVYKGGKKTNSPMLKAQALDHFLDSIGTFLTFVILLLIYLLKDNDIVKMFDPIVSIVISLIIITGAIKIFIENASSLVDKSASKSFCKKIEQEILSVNGVIHIDGFRSRIAANRIFIEVEITVDENMLLKDAHKIADNVRNVVLSNNSDVKNCLVHVNPLIHDDDSEVYK